jgi:hypothetical protein
MWKGAGQLAKTLNLLPNPAIYAYTQMTGTIHPSLSRNIKLEATREKGKNAHHGLARTGKSTGFQSCRELSDPLAMLSDPTTQPQLLTYMPEIASPHLRSWTNLEPFLYLLPSES